MEIIKFNENHLEYASELFTGNYIKVRENLSILPIKYENKDHILPLLHDFYQKSIGVVAIDNSEIIGYLLGLPVSSFKGSQPGIYCPEWSHAAVGRDRPEVYQILYEEASALWLQNGCLNHAVSIMAYDTDSMNTWFWNGFGLHVVNAVRDLNLLSGKFNTDIEIRKYKENDAEEIIALLFEYKKYMAGSPIYLPLMQIETIENINKWLEHPEETTLWLGLSEGNIVALMKVSYRKSNDAQILCDKDTVSIGVTYTKEQFRGHGITKALLQKAMEEALSKGYQRCAVVFEAQNSSGRNFWLKYFKPACYSLVRKVDDRIISANPNRS